MAKPIVAIVGRPNVGKSTLFNKLTGQRLAIVEDTPGVTRDRIFCDCEWCGHKFLLVDTGGIEPNIDDGLLAHMREQAQIAIDSADCIIMVGEIGAGVTAQDQDIAGMLMRSGKPVILAVNKCDKVGEPPMELYDFYSLGIGDIVPISSVHGHGTGDLLDTVCENLHFDDNDEEEEDRIPVAVIGRPNVGKSSLTNHLVGEKVAIVTQKAQTTRNRITGIITKGPVQYVLLDTPGIHKPRNRLDSRMTQTAAASLKDVDVTLMLFEPTGEFTESELGMVEALRKAGPAIAVINKVDLLNDFAALEARKKQVEEFGIFDAIVTVSAKDGTGCEELFPLLKQYANPGPHYFDDDAFTDMPEKELVAELVREKALLFMREEIPHGIAVTVESFKERPDSDLIDISVEICCERKSHKGMIIGKGGQMLKKIASAARMDCEELLGARVNLQCWVKVREDWRDNDRLLDNLGFAKP